MQGKRILVVGHGKLGRRVAYELAEKHQVTALKRSPIAKVDALELCFADVTSLESLRNVLSQSLNDGVDYLIYCLSPSQRSEAAYRDAYLIGLKNVLASLPKPGILKHILFISSTSVFHQANGEEVDELSPCLPSNFSGKVLLEAEAYLASLTVPSTSIRFSGIYGGDRSRLIEQVKQALENGDTLVAGAGYTNRIHEDDCVGFICHLVELLNNQQTVEACYVASDSCPVELAEVYQHIARELQAGKETQELQIIVSEDATSFRRAGSKRCKNERMKKSGYLLKYETYKEGYSCG